MTLKFATASLSQLEAINRLLLCAFTPYVQKLGRGQTTEPFQRLEAAISRGDVYVGLDETEIVGIVTTSRRGDELVIEQLAVDPTRQGAGIGSWLLKQIEQIARHDQVKALSLHTAEMMSDLLRLYNRHGFLETGKALPAHGGDKHLRIYMKKLL